jgi:hypothetical protein
MLLVWQSRSNARLAVEWNQSIKNSKRLDRTRIGEPLEVTNASSMTATAASVAAERLDAHHLHCRLRTPCESLEAITTDFVKLLFRNVLGPREPDFSGHNHSTSAERASMLEEEKRQQRAGADLRCLLLWLAQEEVAHQVVFVRKVQV